MVKERACVVENKGLGEICVNDDGISLSIRDEVVQKIKNGIMKNLAFIQPEARKIASRRIAELSDPDVIHRTIPFDNVKMVGFLETDNKKSDPILVLSLDDATKDKLKLKGNFMSFDVNKGDLDSIRTSLPKGVKTTNRMDRVLKSTRG